MFHEDKNVGLYVLILGHCLPFVLALRLCIPHLGYVSFQKELSTTEKKIGHYKWQFDFWLNGILMEHSILQGNV